MIKMGCILGEFTGYKTRPSDKVNGRIQIKKYMNEYIWIEALCVRIPGLGVKCIDDYIVNHQELGQILLIHQDLQC